MMASLRFWLLGAPFIECNGQRVHFERRLALALAIYLAVTRHVHRRDTLAAFFWPQADKSTGHANLRRIVHTLNAKFGKEFALVEDDEIGIQTDADVWMDLCISTTGRSSPHHRVVFPPNIHSTKR